MSVIDLDNLDERDVAGEATRDRIFTTAERLFALHGFSKVSVRDITTEARVNLAAVNYHFGSKDALLNDIFRTRGAQLNRTRARILHEAEIVHGGKLPVRAILTALISPPIQWSDPAHERHLSLQFLIRARSEGTKEMMETLRKDLTAVNRFAEALSAARPDLSMTEVYWRLHFVLGITHQNRPLEMERLRTASGGIAGDNPVEDQIAMMVDFAEAGFNR